MCECCGEQDAVQNGLCLDCLLADTASSEGFFGGIQDDFGVVCGHEDFPCCGC